MNGSKEPQTRLHALDAFRAAMMLSVVVLHASVSYMTIQMPDLLWVVHDADSSDFFNWLFWWIQGFAMPGFFLISGFWSRSLSERMTLSEFFVKRAKRLVGPFIIACVFILPVVISYGPQGGH